jgi:hypothetical protein
VIESDLDLRNRWLLEEGGAGSSRDRVEHAHDLLADAAQQVQVIAVDLDYERTVRATDQVIDTVRS